MSGMKERMIEAFERGECDYAESYDYMRERMADAADMRRKAERENEPQPERGESDGRQDS